MSAPLARRELRFRMGRFMWLVVAVTVAVGFTSGSFGFSAQLTKLLDTTGEGTSELDVLPQGTVVLTADADSITSATALDDRLLAKVRSVDGVALAEGSYDQPVAFRLPSGTQTERPVILRGVVLSSTYASTKWTVVSGRRPEGPHEIAVDEGGRVVGQTKLGAVARVEVPTGVRNMQVVGIVRPTSATDTPSSPDPTALAASIALASAHVIFDESVAPTLLDAVGRVDRITVAPVPGLDPAVLERRIRDAVPPGVRVSSALDRAAVTQHTIEKIDDGIQDAVSAFAALTVLMSSLVVMNTLSVIVAQRTREFGLLRMVGASRARVLRMVLAESLGVGIAGASLGFGLGVVLAYLAAKVVRDSTVPVGFEATPAMAVVALVVGLGVTLVGGLVPALRAGRVPPLAALSDTRGGAERATPILVPVIALIGGIALAAFGVSRQSASGDVSVGLVGAGVLIAFAGIAGISRWIVRPLLTIFGRGFAVVGGPATRLGLGNARRQPSRTAGAASTLMVGLALVGFTATIGSSIRSTVESQFDTASRADLYLERRGVVRVSPNAVLERLARKSRNVSEYVDFSSVDGVVVGRNGSTSAVSASFLPSLASMVDLGVTSGALPDIESTQGRFGSAGSQQSVSLILSKTAASRLDLSVGDQATLRTVSGSSERLRVAALFTNTALTGDAVVDVTIDPAAIGTFELGLVRFAEHADSRSVRSVTRVASHFSKVRAHTPREFGELNASVTDTVLRIIGVVLVGMIGIGYLGLVATLGLSTLERRKELVMLRAIGAARAQVRSMVWVEATLIGLMAAVIGLGAGVGLGLVGARFVPAELLTRTVVPWSVLLGVGSASLMIAWAVSLGVARRASKVPPAEAGRTF